MVYRWQVFSALAVILCCHSFSLAARAAEDDAAYTKTLTERAAKIIAPLELSDAAKTERVRNLVVEQYRKLGQIHDDRDAQIKDAKKQPGDQTVSEAFVGVVRNRAALELDQVHRWFVARLAAELTPDEVEKIKDGMTYGVVDVTHRGYLDMLPALTDEQKSEIKANLLEAREYAMDGGSSEEKHAIFGKYKGRINNYLSAAGYDLKQAEKDWAERRKSSAKSDNQ